MVCGSARAGRLRPLFWAHGHGMGHGGGRQLHRPWVGGSTSAPAERAHLHAQFGLESMKNDAVFVFAFHSQFLYYRYGLLIRPNSSRHGPFLFLFNLLDQSMCYGFSGLFSGTKFRRIFSFFCVHKYGFFTPSIWEDYFFKKKTAISTCTNTFI